MGVTNDAINDSRLYTVLFDRVKDTPGREKLLENVIAYIDSYSAFNRLSASDVIQHYDNFIRTYNSCLKGFEQTGNYPAFSGEKIEVGRVEYDIALLLSVLLTAHRFRIMELLSDIPCGANALFVGTGPGLEIALTRNRFDNIYAFDLSINAFLYHHFTAVQFEERLFEGSETIKFDAIFLIEILEHLHSPYGLLEDAARSLADNGRIYLTTATNIPQFDHLYNFEESHAEFRQKLNQLRLCIIYEERIDHKYITMKTNAINHFYILTKDTI